MKKTLFVACIAIAALAGCKSGSTKTGDDGKTDVSSKTDANAIIAYTNDVLEVVKTGNESIEAYLKYYGKVSRKWNGEAVYDDIRPSYYSVDKRKAATAFAEPTSSLGNDQKFFKDSVGLYKNLYTTFFQQDSALKAYIDAQDYKDDKYAKGKDIISKQMEIYPQVVRLRFAISAQIEKVADVAEELLLKDDPLKPAYMAAKTDLKKIQSLLDFIAERETYTDAELATIDSSYSTLVADIEKSKAIDKTELDKANKTDSYNRLYNNYLTPDVIKLKAIVRNIKEKKRLTENDYSTVNSINSDVVRGYNIWVN